MKKTGTQLKKFFAIMLVVALSITLLPTANISAKTSKTSVNMTQKNVTAYYYSSQLSAEESVYYNGKSDIPYYDLEDLKNTVFDSLNQNNPSGITLTSEMKGNKLTWTRLQDQGGLQIGFRVIFDFKKNTITFDDINGFFRKEYGSLVGAESITGLMFLFDENLDQYNRYGKQYVIKLNDYGIKLLKDDEKQYIPLQTASDIFLSRLWIYALFNGETIIYNGSYSLPEDLQEIYFSAEQKKMSKKFAAFNYGEICLAFDYMYGLKETHDINTFDEFFKNTGLRQLISLRESYGTDIALYMAINLYFDDLHCAFGGYSYNTDKETLIEGIENIPQGAYRDRYYTLADEIKKSRAEYFPDGIIPYEEVGDTAYITFDEFSLDLTQDHTVLPTDDDLPVLGNDTIRLMQYSVEKITRKNSPIKKVVLDLSDNGGGVVFTAAYLLSAFLGNSSIALKDMITGATSMVNYKADLNLDGVVDEKDTLDGKGLELYCLISGTSYSCANMVPCVFKDSGKVTLIGRTSGGGSCCVQPMCTASGAILQISGPYRFSFSKNGGLYDCDRGAEPDVYIRDMSKLYNREYLNNIIDGIE